MIDLKNVTKIYPKNIIALDNVSLTVNSGEFLSVVGQSGAGKSTLIKLLILEERPTKGNIIINKWDFSKIKDSQIPFLRREIGVVFQDYKLLPKKTVYENVAFALEVSGVSTSIIKKNVPDVLDIVRLTNKAKSFPDELSGGEQQRVALARSLVHKPKILVADEPTGNLDALHALEILELLLKINKLGTTVIMATHNRELVNSINRRVVTLDKGKITKVQKKGKYLL